MLQIEGHACGMALDMLRACYRVDMRLSRDRPPIPMQWFFVDDDTPFLPYAHCMGSHVHDDPPENDGIGEQVGDAEDQRCLKQVPFVYGNPPASYAGTGPPCGSERVFAGGWTEDDPLYTTLPDGRCAECLQSVCHMYAFECLGQHVVSDRWEGGARGRRYVPRGGVPRGSFFLDGPQAVPGLWTLFYRRHPPLPTYETFSNWGTEPHVPDGPTDQPWDGRGVSPPFYQFDLGLGDAQQACDSTTLYCADYTPVRIGSAYFPLLVSQERRLTLPPAVEGDMQIVLVRTNSKVYTPTAPGSWRPLALVDHPTQNLRLTSWYRRRVAGDPGDVLISWEGAAVDIENVAAAMTYYQAGNPRYLQSAQGTGGGLFLSAETPKGQEFSTLLLALATSSPPTTVTRPNAWVTVHMPDSTLGIWDRINVAPETTYTADSTLGASRPLVALEILIPFLRQP